MGKVPLEFSATRGIPVPEIRFFQGKPKKNNGLFGVDLRGANCKNETDPFFVFEASQHPSC